MFIPAVYPPWVQSRNPEKEVVEPAIFGTLNVLRSVCKARTAK